MKLESIDTKEIKTAFLEQIIPVLQQQGCSQEEFNGMTYFLDQFLTLIDANNILFVKLTDDAQRVPQQQLQEMAKPENKINVQEYIDENLPEDEEELSAEDKVFREEYLKKLEEEDAFQAAPPQSSPPQPTRFTEKIRALKIPTRREEDDDDEY